MIPMLHREGKLRAGQTMYLLLGHVLGGLSWMEDEIAGGLDNEESLHSGGDAI